MSEGLHDYPGFLPDIIRGDTVDFSVVMTQNGSAIDITGAKFYLSFAQDLDVDTAETLQITISEHSDPTNGTTTGQITDTQTLALDAGMYWYSLRYVTAAGAAYVIDYGRVEVINCVVGDIT